MQPFTSIRTLGALNSQEITIAADPDQVPSETPLHEPNHPPVIFGTGLSSRASIAALIRYGSMENYELFALPQRLDVVRRSVAPLAESLYPPKTIRVHDQRALLRDFDKLGIAAWYDAHADIWRSAYVRSNFSTRLYPIAGTIHTISYQSLLRKFYPSILLSDTYPCDSIVCTSTAARDAFRNLLKNVAADLECEYGLRLEYKGHLDVIPLGVDTQVFRPRDKQVVRKALDLPQDACIVLYVGRLSITDKMDLFPLLHAFRDCVQSSGRKNLLLITGTDRGGGNTESVSAEIRSLGIGEHVQILTGPSSTAWLYSAADIFVSLSDNLQESFGNTLAEALASGVPAVVSDWDGYRDTVEHSKTGFIVPTYWVRSDDDLALIAPLSHDNCAFDHCSVGQSVAVDLRCFRSYLQKLIDNPALRANMSVRSRERAEQIYSWPAIVRQYEELWRSLLADVDKVAFKPRRRARYAQPRFFDTFSGYASRVLTGNSCVRITASGSVALQNGTLVPEHHLARTMRVLDPQLMTEALDALKGFSNNNASGVPIESLVAAVPSANDHHPHAVGRHVQWLIKYGYAEVIDSR